MNNKIDGSMHAHQLRVASLLRYIIISGQSRNTIYPICVLLKGDFCVGSKSEVICIVIDTFIDQRSCLCLIKEWLSWYYLYIVNYFCKFAISGTTNMSLLGSIAIGKQESTILSNLFRAIAYGCDVLVRVTPPTQTNGMQQLESSDILRRTSY